MSLHELREVYKSLSARGMAHLRRVDGKILSNGVGQDPDGQEVICPPCGGTGYVEAAHGGDRPCRCRSSRVVMVL